MKINRVASVSETAPKQESNKVGSAYRSGLERAFEGKAFTSFDDKRLPAIRQAMAADPGLEKDETYFEILKALGPDWGLSADGSYSLRPKDDVAQSFRISSADGGTVTLDSSLRRKNGLDVNYLSETLSQDGSGRLRRDNAPVVTTHLPPKDTLCEPVDTLFSSPFPAASGVETLRSVYYRPRSEALSLQSEIARETTEHDALLRKLEQRGAISAEEAASRKAAFGNPVWNKTTGTEPELQRLQELEQDAFHLLHQPQQVADGLYRSADFYVSPRHLDLRAKELGWDLQPDEKGHDVPVADAVVVGAGPGGLSTALQLARRGARVVTFESETAGAAFSDAGAKPVHHLRTSGYLSNLVKDGFDYFPGDKGLTAQELEHPASIYPRLEEYGKLAEAGRNGLESLTGLKVHDIPTYPYGFGATSEPAARGVFFAHLSKVAQTVATEHDNSFLCERSPVSKVTYKDGLYTVETARGHKVKTRNLVLATGLTGKSGENARVLPLFSELAKAEPGIFENLTDSRSLPAEGGGPMLLGDRSLGEQGVRQALQALPEGSRAAVVGSGESALKGALEMLELNPGLSVDLFVKGPVESAQVQIPPEYFFNPDAVWLTPGSDVRARAEAKRFGTPLTPRSLQLFLEFQKAGRARLLEMGDYFDQKTMKVSAQAGKIAVEVVSPEVAANLEKGSRYFEGQGLLPVGSAPPMRYDAVVQAVGYRAPKPDKLEFMSEMGLPDEAKEHLYVNTSGSPEHQTQSTIPGLAVRGRLIAEEIATGLAGDRVKVKLEPKRILFAQVLDFTSDAELAQVPFFLSTGGLNEFGYRSMMQSLDSPNRVSPETVSRLFLTEFDSRLRDIYAKPDAERTPEERETLKRGVALAERMRGLHLPPRDEIEALNKAGKLRQYVEHGPSLENPVSNSR